MKGVQSDERNSPIKQTVRGSNGESSRSETWFNQDRNSIISIWNTESIRSSQRDATYSPVVRRTIDWRKVPVDYRHVKNDDELTLLSVVVDPIEKKDRSLKRSGNVVVAIRHARRDEKARNTPTKQGLRALGYASLLMVSWFDRWIAIVRSKSVVTAFVAVNEEHWRCTRLNVIKDGNLEARWSWSVILETGCSGWKKVMNEWKATHGEMEMLLAETVYRIEIISVFRQTVLAVCK